ncbi:MAG: ATP synthase F0 subunit B [Terracidiphilus sp.]|jgi:F-type H+-transporting ATPase subunit b
MPRIHCILFFLALAIGVAATPSRLAAQAAGQASQTAAQPASQAAPEKQSDEAQANVFRLEGPIVKWTANTFHTSPETAATVFEFLNFAVIVFGIGIPLFKFLPKFLKRRSEKVRSDIESARKVTEDAGARLSAIEEKLAGLDGEIKVIRAQVEAESRQDRERIQASMAEESARIVAAAEQEIGASAAQARRSLRNFAADLAIDQAAKQLVLTPETDRALIAEFLGDAALNGPQAGGRN